MPLYYNCLFFCVCVFVLPMFFASLSFFFSFLLCLWLGSSNALCLFIYSLFFFSFVCGSVLPVSYASLFIFFFSFVSVAWFCQCSLPLCFSFFLFFCVCGSDHPMLYAFLFMVFFFVSFVCGSVLPVSYASLFILFFSFVSVARLCQCSMHLYCIFSFLLCLWLGFANVICLFLIIVSFLLCLSLGFGNVLCLFI